jgi:sortase A
MNPNDDNNNQNQKRNQDAAADVLRSQIDRIYNHGQEEDPYERTHQPNPQPEQEQWAKYHTAWQEYYQKYYEGYYTHHLNQIKTKAPDQSKGSYFSEQPETPNDDNSADISNMRQNILGKVKESAKSARKSRHFVPIASALIVVFVFLFLQFNRVLVSNVVAYVSPGSIDPQNIIVSPEGGNIEVGDESKLIIPKINVDVPVIYGIGNDYDSQMAAMEKGVAHFAIPGASSRPGQVGNTAIAGHSSNDIFDSSRYKFIFAQLDRLKEGDMIYANYDGLRYSYVVTKKEVVKPTEINKLVYDTDKPMMTLITCTPLGTALKRLLVTAEQVSPDPTVASEAPEIDEAAQEAQMPGNTQSILERIFGR